MPMHSSSKCSNDAGRVANPKLLARDINAIEPTGLIERQHGKVRARREIIQAFLPRRSQ